MNWFNKLMSGTKQPASAGLAKERLSVIIARQRNGANEPDFLPKLRSEILEVLSRYIKIEEESLDLQMHRNDEGEVLELNVSFDKKETTSA